MKRCEGYSRRPFQGVLQTLTCSQGPSQYPAGRVMIIFCVTPDPLMLSNGEEEAPLWRSKTPQKNPASKGL